MILDRVICGVDGSPESLEAARVAADLAGGTLTIVTALDPWDRVLRGPAGAGPADEEREAAERALRDAVAGLRPRGGVDPVLVTGRPQHALVDECRRRDATLLVVGSVGRSRMRGIVIGSVATALAHEAPASVLIVRGEADRTRFPRVAVVGVDGSPCSGAALDAAREIAAARGTQLRVVAAERGCDATAVARVAAGTSVRTVPGGAVAALTSAAADADADLVVVGSRGLTGLRALGSVGERLVHTAACSVLLVRDAPQPH